MYTASYRFWCIVQELKLCGRVRCYDSQRSCVVSRCSSSRVIRLVLGRLFRWTFPFSSDVELFSADLTSFHGSQLLP